MNKSIATINSPQFINLQPLDINPLMSKCEIKVLYVGGNRNGSFISKETATEMAKTLRGAPIVGYWNKDKEDFGDHGQRVIIEEGQVKFECLTVPYGFVSPDSEVWFQEFEDTDEFGNVETREYLMTTGYLWTGQYKECEAAVKGSGRPHSMELDEETLQGRWSIDKKTDMEFFIINDAIFSKLCILGEDVEPCFEGSSVSAPNISKTFSMDNGFKTTLFSMMQDLKDVIKGGQQMEVNKDNVVPTTEPVEPVQEPAVEPTEEPVVEPVQEPSAEPVVETPTSETDVDFAASKDKDKKEGEETDPTPEEPEKEEPKKDEEDDEEKKKAEKYALIETELAELQEKYAALETDYTALSEEVVSLRAFKSEIEVAEKDKLINSFCMLSEEDKKEVIENKSSYTLEQIEEKLSVICVRKKINFNLEAEVQGKENQNVTYTLDYQGESEPAWVSAVKNNQKR